MNHRPDRREFVGASLKAGAVIGLTGGLGQMGCAPAPEPLRILILGGTSFLGPHQVKYALDRGHEVSIFTRGRTEPPFFHDYFERTEQLVGDRNEDLAALEGREWDAVLDNSATLPRWVRMTAELLRDRVDRYLFVSSISAYRDFGEAGIDENYPVAELSAPDVEEMREYGALKAAAEAVASSVFGASAINVRPGLIVGPGDNTDRWTYWPVRLDRGGETLAPNVPEDPVQNIDVRDLARWTVDLVETPGNGGTYNAVGDPGAFGTMLDEIRAAISSEATFIWVPTEFMAEHGVRPWGHLTNWVPVEGETLGMNQVANDAAVAAGLAFRPIGETALDTLEWWKTLSEERRAAPRAGLPDALEEEVLAAWADRSAGLQPGEDF